MRVRDCTYVYPYTSSEWVTVCVRGVVHQQYVTVVDSTRNVTCRELTHTSIQRLKYVSENSIFNHWIISKCHRVQWLFVYVHMYIHTYVHAYICRHVHGMCSCMSRTQTLSFIHHCGQEQWLVTPLALTCVGVRYALSVCAMMAVQGWDVYSLVPSLVLPYLNAHV